MGGILELVRHAGPGSGLLPGPRSALMPAVCRDTAGHAVAGVVPSPRNGGQADSGLPQDLLAALVRPPCHLEILIPSLNEAERLPRTLIRTIEYLEAQAYSSSLVVVDNGSIDQTVDLVSAGCGPAACPSP